MGRYRKTEIFALALHNILFPSNARVSTFNEILFSNSFSPLFFWVVGEWLGKDHILNRPGLYPLGTNLLLEEELKLKLNKLDLHSVSLSVN